MPVTPASFESVALEDSFIVDVIYDDTSVTLEMEFRLAPAQGDAEQGASGEELRPGFIRFSEIDDLRIRNSSSASDEEGNRFPIKAATIEGDYAFIDSNWGEIELTAKAMRLVVD